MNEDAPSHGWTPLVCAAVTGMQGGASIVATRAVVDHLDPVPMTCLRYLVGACVLVPIALRLPRRAIPRRYLASMAGLELLQFGLLIVLLTFGLKSVPGRAHFSTSLVFAMAIAVAMGQERPNLRRGVGIGLALAGLAIALSPALRSQGGDSVTGWCWWRAGCVVRLWPGCGRDRCCGSTVRCWSVPW